MAATDTSTSFELGPLIGQGATSQSFTLFKPIYPSIFFLFSPTEVSFGTDPSQLSLVEGSIWPKNIDNVLVKWTSCQTDDWKQQNSKNRFPVTIG